MKYSERYKELNAQFKLGIDTYLRDSGISIRFFSFKSIPLSATNLKAISNPTDETINENLSFIYPVFTPRGNEKSEKAILLLHGLNERNWSKYLTWAEFLCQTTGKPVILFPLAFHMNRSPVLWSNPRSLLPLLDCRQRRNGEDRSLSFANVALSERVSESPMRFYSSGRQSMYDLSNLFSEIRQGKHSLFKEDTHIDIFSYSIGSFLSQITIMTDPDKLFSDAKLFMFCGGSIFSSMFGESRSIMDRTAFIKLLDFYLNDFDKDDSYKSNRDKAYNSFFSMISPDRNKQERESFFEQMDNRISGISLAKDKVIPYQGVELALGTQFADKKIKLEDFNFEYCHENPFPVNNRSILEEVDQSFNKIFSQAAFFLT